MPSSSGDPLPRIAVFAGPTATVLASPPLVTSEKARVRHGLTAGSSSRRVDGLRPQRLAAPVTVFVEQFSAHPLEETSAALYAPPDGYLDAEGSFHREAQSADDVPVYEVTLEPEDGLYLLPYMARQADGSAWEGDAADPQDPGAGYRQAFYPDAERLFEEIDRFVLGADGRPGVLSSRAEYVFRRPAPSAGYPDRPSATGSGDTGPGSRNVTAGEKLGVDYFPYRPPALRREPLAATLAKLTNEVQQALQGGCAGGLWLEGSPFVEETAYWLNLLVDTTLPIVCCAGSMDTGRLNVVDAVTYLTSCVWADEEGRDRLGVVCVLDEQVFTAREVQKSDDRPGGFRATGGHGGVVGTIGKPGPPVVTFVPNREHTWSSQLRLTELPERVPGLRVDERRRFQPEEVRVRDEAGDLRAEAIPAVRIIKHVRYLQREPESDDTAELELFERLDRDLATSPLVGVVLEAGTPYGDGTAPLETALQRAMFSGVPVVKVGRGDVGGFVPTERVPLGIAGGNLTATKARMLLMACLLKFGALPPARDPQAPSDEEERLLRAALDRYQRVFDTH